jgi:CMP-N,N'-diacetyllegionaminic acid synthase
MHSAIAIIPARSGSKGILNKNTAPLAGFPLIAYSIVAAKLTPGISRVIVSTDSEKYAELSRSYGAEVPFLRPTEFSGDSSTDTEFMVHAMNWFDANEPQTPEYWVHLRPTTPLRDPSKIQEALDLISSDSSATALRSAFLSPESPFKWFRHTNDGYLMSLTSADTNLDKFNLPRQTFPKVYVPDGYVDIIRRSFVKKTGLLHGDKVMGFVSPFCTEVDSEEELRRIEYEVSRLGSPLLNYLKRENI